MITILCGVPFSLSTRLFHSSPDQNDEQATEDARDGRHSAPLYAKVFIIEKARPQDRGVQERNRGRSAAVRKPEYEVLHIVPDHVSCHQEPETAKIVIAHYKQRPDEEHVDEGRNAESRIRGVEIGEESRRRSYGRGTRGREQDLRPAPWTRAD